MITDEQIEKAFEGAIFGPMVETSAQRKKYIAQAIFKRMSQYSTGRTVSNILQELGMTRTLGGYPIKAARRWAYHQYHEPGV